MSSELKSNYQGKTINILVVINTDGVKSDRNNFSKYVRMIDDQRNDPGQFGNDLTVTCHPMDDLIFRVCAVKNDEHVELKEFVHLSGPNVLEDLGFDDALDAWRGVIGPAGCEFYNWKVKIGNAVYTWDPRIEATNS